jgi:hydroxyacylglutathione hydrolase
MILETFQVGMLQCNCTILADETAKKAIVIDPGDAPDQIISRLERHGLELAAIVCTHAHIDHVGALAELQERTGADALLHERDLFLYDNLEAQASWIGMICPRRGEISRFLNDGDLVACPSLELGVLHTPGHTPGSLTFDLDRDRRILFTGDTLFLSSIGRTDLWGGSLPTLLDSIKQRLLVYDDATLVVPGHGPSTTIGQERHENPFLR